MPAPGGGSANGVHDRMTKDLRQRCAPDVEGGESEEVDAHIVVFVVRAGWVHGAIAHGFDGVTDGAIGPIGDAPEFAGPVAGLAQKMVPGDRGVVGRSE